MIHFTSTKKLCLALSFVIIIAVVIYGGSVYLIRSKVMEVSKYEIKAGEKTSLDMSNRSLINLIESNKPEIDRLMSRVVKKDGTVAFIDKVESYARSSGVSVLVENVEERKLKEPIEGYQELHLNVKTQGSWEGTYKFLSLLETFPYKITIESADIRNDVRTDVSTSTPSVSTWNSLISVSVLQQK